MELEFVTHQGMGLGIGNLPFLCHGMIGGKYGVQQNSWNSNLGFATNACPWKFISQVYC